MTVPTRPLEGARRITLTYRIDAAPGTRFVPQDKSLFPDMTVRENVRMGGYILADRREIELTTPDKYPVKGN